MIAGVKIPGCKQMSIKEKVKKIKKDDTNGDGGKKCKWGRRNNL